jgi:hypothetical protein
MKNKAEKTFSAGVAGLLAGIGLLLSGCIGVDYVGQSFEPRSEYDGVVIFDQETEMPAENYRVIGRATLTVPNGYSTVDVHEKIEAVIREQGADAAKITEKTKRLVASHYSQPSLNDKRSGPIGNIDTSFNEFGENISMEERRKNTYEHIIKVLVLMKRDRFDEIMAKREAQKTAGAPAAAAVEAQTAAAAVQTMDAAVESAEKAAETGEASAVPVAAPAERTTE